MNKKGEENSIWTVVVAILALIVLIILVYVFREPILTIAEKLKDIVSSLGASDVDVSKLVEP